MDQSRYDTSVVAKYIYTAAIKENSNFNQTNLPHDMIFTKEDAYTRDEQVEVLSLYYIIHYRSCLGSLIYILSKIMDLCFAVQNLETFLSNTGKVHFLLICIGYKRNLGLEYYSKM